MDCTMLVRISKKCTDILISIGKISEERRTIYEYGFELLFSTTNCITCILILSLLGNCFRQAIVFLLYFIPIRISGGGYHAKSYRNCFLLTNIMAFGSIFFAEVIWRNQSRYIELLLGACFIWSLFFIWKVAPIIPIQYRYRTNREKINRKYAHAILIIEIVVLIHMRYYNFNFSVYTAIVTSCLVAFMMKLVKEGGK